MLNAVYARMNTFGRIAVCGLISGYGAESVTPRLKDFSGVLMRRLRIQGFVVADHLNLVREAQAELIPWISSGKMRWKDHVVEGLENALDTLQLLF